MQFELAGSYGIDDGRYPVRSPDGGKDGGPERTEAVLVARTFGAPPARPRLRRSKPKDVDPEAARTVPVTELTVIETEPVAGDPKAWLKTIRADEDQREELARRGLGHATRALAARRVAGADPNIPDPSPTTAVAIRLGYGSGDALVDGKFDEAIELPRESGRRRRGGAIRPQERMGAMLGGRERTLPCEELILRARADLDAGRLREAALQIRVGLEALLADREAVTVQGQEDDLGFLDTRRTITGEAANEALAGALAEARAVEVAETINVCERVLRRRAARG